jgi:dTDP-4-dehydrorhamnose 3,5-epimerase
MDLPDGVRLTSLKMHHDERGWFSEIFRDEWRVTRPPCQWNVGYSGPNTLRGAHLHLCHQDYFTVLQGCMTMGLFDVRPKSRTYRMSALVELTSDALAAITVPSGVVHAAYSHDSSIHVYGVDHYYNPAEELACRWNDPALGLAWPCTDPVLCERDRSSGSLADVEAALRRMNIEFA